MKKALGWLVIGFSLWPLAGCSSSDESSSDPVALCKEGAKVVCSKYFACFSKEQLAAAASFIGNNEADCVTKLSATLMCTTEGVKCDSGQTFDSGKANECISQYKALSCSEFASDSTAAPAACDQTCK